MSTYNRFASTHLQRLRLQVFTIENECESNERIFAERLAIYIKLLWMLQGDPNNYEEAKEHYHNMLLYCVVNIEYLEKRFNTVRIYVSNIFEELQSFGNRFKFVEKDEDMIRVENKMIELELI
jgi:hypothetical protein